MIGKVLSVEVVNLKSCKDFGTKEGDVYIGRKFGRFQQGSPLGNPFKIDKNTTREQSISKYREWADKNIPDGLIKEKLMISDKIRLGCFCHPLPCHGDYLKERIKKLM